MRIDITVRPDYAEAWQAAVQTQAEPVDESSLSDVVAAVLREETLVAEALWEIARRVESGGLRTLVAGSLQIAGRQVSLARVGLAESRGDA